MSEFKNKILKAIKKAESLGLTVRPGSFGSQSTMKCCPITAVALTKASPNALSGKDNDRFREELVLPIVELELNIAHQDWIRGFIRGYDSLKNEAKQKGANYKHGYDVGRTIHRETIEDE